MSFLAKRSDFVGSLAQVEEGSLGWPFVTLTGPSREPLDYVAVTGPIRTSAQIERFEYLRARVQLVGFTSYLDFPRCRATGEPGPDGRPIRPPDVSQSCIAWCHCFRRPDQFLPPRVPAILLSQSDFTDAEVVGRLGSGAAPLGPERSFDVDFVYVCDAGRWKEVAKNWELAQRCLPVLCGTLGLRGLLVGREELPDLPDGLDGRVTVEPLLPWADLLQRVRRARFAFVPSGLDPSPRLLAESLALDTPVVVNHDILGGWHYVNAMTGAFFATPSDLPVAVRYCLDRGKDGRLRPRDWYAAHHGPVPAGRRLAAFLRTIDRSLEGLDEVRLDYSAGLEGLPRR
ncbi:MAG TPA: hypothetical protein VHX40_00205 [Acidimicrobiales bacterium]|nr:hypothetical protein [Acidimicrobiales bacterium]